ncbi:EAL domain-containing protein [Acinetobacter sp. 194]|uniref:EAL domain-containing protein n=1 Tax=Acinetobacter shaoyimingii TaxID=2715164 RepID=UPI001409C1B9|nr:EAL domain-containing protein [Acinetobacter shaoyimingii]NHB56973.1 EAL domain-containing protein [Acinetobacter shaoyimingii]
MGSLEVRNLFLSKKLKRSEIRILIIDDNQIRYNEILEIFQNNNHLVSAVLLDDLKSFEKQLNTSWDLIIFGRAYDIKIEQAVALIQATSQIDIPLLYLASEDYSPNDYQGFIHKGIYDVIHLNDKNHFYINIIRALSYSRSIQIQQNLSNDLENAKLHTQVLVEEQNKAVATIQEGIHGEANAEYLSLFGIESEDDLVGLPLLDIIQPVKVSEFKNRFKKVSQGQFELGRFEIDTLNTHAKIKNPLKIEFIPSEEPDTIQIAIETVDSNKSTGSKGDSGSAKQELFLNIQRFVKNNPAKENALVVFSLANCPEAILNADWGTFTTFFSRIPEFIKEQTNATLFRIEGALYAIVLQAESSEILDSRLRGLTSLEKPQLITIGDKAFTQKIKLGYSTFKADQFEDEIKLFSLIESAFNTPLPKDQSASDLELSATLAEAEISLTPTVEEAKVAPSEIKPSLKLDDLELAPIAETPTAPTIAETVPAVEAPVEQPITLTQDEIAPPIETKAIDQPSLLSELSKILDRGEIQLKYQQFYDKNDADLHIYEVTSGFIHENEWKNINKLVELTEDPELSSKIDRWILVEACKKLHNFITQYPDAKIVVNLNAQSLVRDKHLTTLISKLISIVGSKLPNPLILQFNEEDFAKNMAESAQAVAALRQSGAEISIRHFGSTSSSEAILKESEISYIKLDKDFTDKLSDDNFLEELNEKIAHYQELRPVEMILSHLDDMGSFANAWNIEPRFLQGDYFQKKLDHLTDVQDQ